MGPKKKQKDEKEKSVLLGLVELYLCTGKPIGSNTLRENGLENISSATIRNYFSKLEEQGFLLQQHSSGGRIPTTNAYKFYADHHIHSLEADPKDVETLKKELDQDTKEIASYLTHASEVLSEITQTAIFLSTPRFDQDLIIDIKLLGIDNKRCLCILVTDFGLIHTEILYTEKKLSSFSLKRIETYFRFRMTGLDRPKLNKSEEAIASKFYNEILIRHIVNYSNFSSEDVYKTGFSKLLHYPEFRDATVLATSLSIFENASYMRGLLHQCCSTGDLQCLIGNDLNYPNMSSMHSSVITVPYFIHMKPVGAIALLGPIRIPYPKLFGTLRAFSTLVSEVLTRNLYKYKITYREPKKEQTDQYIPKAHHLLLEHQSTTAGDLK